MSSHNSRGCLLLIFLSIASLIGCLCIGVAVIFYSAAGSDLRFDTTELQAGSSSEQIAVIDIEGEISGGEVSDLFGQTKPDPVAQIAKLLETSSKDDNVKGVILRFNTPGGTVYDSFNLADKVRKFREDSQKPIISLIETSAASGGYLIASQTDYIITNQTSVVGSIGVIVHVQDTDGLLEKLGIRNIVITSDGAEQKAGQHLDDPNSPDYKNTKQLLNDYQKLFNDYVAAGRKLTTAEVKQLANGSIVSGGRAVDNKLADEVGTLETAVAKVKSLAKLEQDPRVFNYLPIDVGNSNLFGIINRLVGVKVSNRSIWFASIPY